ncbi:TIGR00730 family Rossman fold protein [Salinisphaera sp. USBA-960]|uniref:LOG family protein n=1 Tax=Salinisphaera orenii TaxID=856731 RepID=UPI000DBE600A|nr:TIGR00730 family Rossman fold protein [Salifodinibacter halophilus]NNC26844.1 TIGR00730 family Rossman fold protein [Salifodinibacter halophilus]
MSLIQSVCVYCGSRTGQSPNYVQAARALGGAIAQRGLRLVYGGARIGLMGTLADATIAAGGHTLGVIPESLVAAEVAHDGLTEQRVVADMHARKFAMSEAADAFIALPGGLGTLEELFEMLTWQQLGWHTKPIGLLNVDDYYAPLDSMFDAMTAAGFVSADECNRPLIASEPDTMLHTLQNAVT